MLATCENCKGEFVPRRVSAPSKTCSKECRYELSASKNRASQGKARRVTSTCLADECGGEFTHKDGDGRKFCSHSCYLNQIKREKRDHRACDECGGEITNYTRTNQRFCSVVCRNRNTAKGRRVNYPECRTCGTSTGSYNRTYCDDHRVKPGRKPKPRKAAVCLGCGEEFSRPYGYGGKMKYCSNKCSHAQRKKVRDKFIADLPEGAVVFHSGWEIRFWAACLRHDIPIRSYDGPDIETSEGIYRPDFIVNDSDVVEVKGWLRPESEVKLRESGVTVVREDDLHNFEATGCLPLAGTA